jgi:hypothetical protein
LLQTHELHEEANVEFIHPKLREEMDMQEEDPTNPWVWLTSYSRIPVEEEQKKNTATRFTLQTCFLA